MSLLKKAAKVLAWLLGGLVVLALAGWGVLWVMSPGKAQPIIDDRGMEIPGSVSTIATVTLGGVEQYLIIRARDAGAPVMLYVHGGPGSPEYAMLRQTNLGLEDDFVMVYWEQRGAGKSYDPDNLPEDMSLDRFIADAAELGEILAGRFGQEKIYLMGHSWGSMLGLLVAEARPELFHAYFGLGNVAHQIRGEQMALDWLRGRAAEAGDAGLAQELAALKLPASDADMASWMEYMRVQRGQLDAMGGGFMHEAPGFATMVRWLLVAPEYSIGEKMNYLRGMLFSLEALWEEVVTTNLITQVGRVDVPVYFLQGAHDYQTPTPLARELFEALDAPQKHYVSFEQSAHSPNMEEPEKFNAVVRRAAGLE